MVVNNSISEKRIHQEMLSLEELGDWDSTSPGYLREIAIYNLKYYYNIFHHHKLPFYNFYIFKYIENNLEI